MWGYGGAATGSAVAPTQAVAAPTQGVAPTTAPAPVGDTYPPSKVTPSGSIITSSAYLGFQTVDTNVSGDSATKIYYDEVFD